MKIYQSYDEEPQDVYQPLSENGYRELYDLEMAGFAEDLPFYLDRLPAAATILELGCGSGRLSRLLSSAGHQVTGIDLSFAMLREATTLGGNPSYCCMDMRHLAFTCRFDAIIIPYNTLNLLHSNAEARCCLQECRRILADGGSLLLQVHVMSEAKSIESNRSFQFQIFDRPAGGKVIKETLRTLDTDTSILHLEERYKIRPMNKKEPNLNFSHQLLLNANSRSTWCQLLEASGFTIIDSTDRYLQTSSPQPSMLLIHARYF